MARRQKGNPDEAVTRELARITFSRGGPTLTAAQLSVMEDLLCVNGQLPAEFRAFLSRQNGRDPSPSAFAWHRPQDGEHVIATPAEDHVAAVAAVQRVVAAAAG